MKNYRFYNRLSENNKEYLQQAIGLVEAVIKQSEEIKEQQMNTYLFLLDEVSELLENQRAISTKEECNWDECTEEARLEAIKSVYEEFKEMDAYVDELKAKLRELLNRGLVQNVEFRQKNLRGAKVEDLYFKISNLVNESVSENDYSPLNGMICGESLLSFIREEFEYRPIYRSYLKEEIIERLEKADYIVYDIQHSLTNLNESIFKHGFILKEDEKEKVVLVIKENTNENEIHYAMDELTKTEKDLYFIAENQKVLLNQGRKIVFGWVGQKNPGLENKMNLAIHFSTLQRIKSQGMWETTDFSLLHNEQS